MQRMHNNYQFIMLQKDITKTMCITNSSFLPIDE